MALSALLLLAPLPALANHASYSAHAPDGPVLSNDEAGAVARATGCDANVVRLKGRFNGFFTGSTVAVIYEGWESRDAVMLVLLHELAHCEQYREGRIGVLPNPWTEFEADARALEWGPRFGVTNLAADIEFLIAVTRDRDPHGCSACPHGSPAARVLFNEWQLRRLNPNYGFQGA